VQSNRCRFVCVLRGYFSISLWLTFSLYPDDLVFAMDERIIERIDKNAQMNFSIKTEPHTPPNGSATPTSLKSSPTTTLPTITISSLSGNGRGGATTPTNITDTLINGGNLATPPTPTPDGGGVTSKLCHLQEDQLQRQASSSCASSNGSGPSSATNSSSLVSLDGCQPQQGGFSHSATISSSMQGVELEQANHMIGGAIVNQHAPHMYDSPMQQWADKILLVNQGPMAITR